MDEIRIKVNANNEIDKIGFSDKSVERFGLFLANMAGANSVVIEKVYDDGQGSACRLDVDDEDYFDNNRHIDFNV